MSAEELWPVPPSWAWATMSDMAEVVGGGTPSTTDTSNFGGDIPWITPADLSGYRAKFIGHGARNVTEKGLSASGARLMPEGTVLLSSRAPVGYVAIASNPLTTNQGFKSFVPADGMSSSYVYYWLLSATDMLRRLSSGTTFLELSGKRAGEVPIPIAPLPEQHRIVEAIETQLPCVDAALAGLQRVRTNLKRYRASVLKAAAEGTLLRGDSPTIGNRVQVKDILSEPLINGRSVPDATEGFPVLRLTCLKTGRIDLSERKIGRWNREEAKRFLVRRGDFLVSRGNGSIRLVGRGGLVIEEPDEVAFPDTLIRLRVKPIVNPKYLSLIWESQVVRRQIEGTARTTAGIHKINQSDIEGFSLPLPPTDLQERIVDETERMFSVLNSLEDSVQIGIKRSERLRQAILKTAFWGRLVGQDPEDEPASVLLARISAERQGSSPSGLRARKRRGRSKASALASLSLFEVTA